MNMIDVQDKLKGLSEQQLIGEMQSPTGTAPQFLVLSEITRRKRMRDSFQNQQAQPTTSIAEEAIASAGVPGGGIASMARSMAPNSSIAQNTAAMPSQPMPQEQPVQGMYAGGAVHRMADGGDVPNLSRSLSEDDWFLDMLNPVENARQAYLDYQDGDYLGSAINIASTIPWGKSVGMLGNAALMVAPSVYDYMKGDDTDDNRQTPNVFYTGGPVHGMYGGGYVQKMAGGMSVDGKPIDMSNPMVAAWVRAESQRLADLGPTGNALVRQSRIKNDRNRMLGLEPVGDGMTFPTQSDLDMRFAQGQGRESIFPNSGFSEPAPRSIGMDFSRPIYDTLAGRTSTLLPEDVGVDLDLTAENQSFPAFEEYGRTPQGNTIDDQIARLKATIGSEITPAVERARAVDELQKLQQRTATTQFGGNVNAVSSGIDIPAGYVMSTMGLMPDPNYVTPGRSGVSGVDQAALQGTDALSIIIDAVPHSLIKEAAPAARQANWERERNRLNLEEKVISDQLSNPFVPNDLRTEMLDRIAGISKDRDRQGAFPNTPAPESKTMSVPELAPDRDVMSILDAAGYDPMSDAAIRDILYGNKPEAAVDDTVPEKKDAGGENDQGGVPTVDNRPVTRADVGGGGNGGTGQSGGAMGAGVGGAAGNGSSYEQELRDAMGRAEKRANQDKWLALAQVGMQLMSSKEPTLGGALGEAGIAGLQAFRGSRDAYENERLGLSKSLYDLQQQQAAALAAQRAAATKATGGSYGIKDIMGIADQYDKAIKSMMVDDGLGGLAMPTDEESVARIAELKREKDKYIGMLIPQSTFDATAQ